MRKVTFHNGSTEVQHNESSEETFRKFHLGFVNRTRVLRPQRSAFGKHPHGSLSTRD